EPHVAGIILTTVCDQMRRGYEFITDRGLPSFCFNVPATWCSESAVQLYVSELERLSRFLVSLGGRQPDTNAIRDAIHECSPSPSTVAGGGQIPLALTGGPRTKLDERLIDLIEETGGHIVLDATESGLLGVPAVFNMKHVDTDPMRALAEAYHSRLPGVSRRPNDDLHTFLAAQVTASQASGVILLRYLWCDLWHAEVPRIRKALPVPLLDIDLDGEDPVPRNRTRIQAFMEGLG
ncbi:MAG: 2-hydroxyacyl-CoA dehydratase, partial [Victivallales bacterium]|nr:2-hydroxyacyl-CoA dehydratase [Victivallales bacterium]